MATYLRSIDSLLHVGSHLDPHVVEQAFRYSLEHRIPLSAFLGDTCSTLFMAPELQELHEVYYEPLSQVQPDLESILHGPPVKKLLFMTDPQVVDSKLKPHWNVSHGLYSNTCQNHIV